MALDAWLESPKGKGDWQEETMNQFQRYLLDEFVDDYKAGEMSRRDFVMKVIGVSGGLAAALGLFSSVGLSAAEIAAAQAAPRVMQTGPNPVTISPNDPDIMVMDVQFPTADGSTLLGYMAMPSAPGTYAGVVVIHENRGLLEHHKDIARRYAKAGFAAVAPDLVSREGGTDIADPDQVPGFLANADPQRHVDDATAAGAFLQAQDGVRLGRPRHHRLLLRRRRCVADHRPGFDGRRGCSVLRTAAAARLAGAHACRGAGHVR